MKFSLTMLTVAAAMLIPSESQAQGGFAAAEMNRLQSVSRPNSIATIRNSTVNSAVPRYSFAGVNPGLSLNALSRPNKPFSSISRGPSVTPYLALDNPFTSPATSYYTQIRPQLEQQRINQQQERQNQQMQRQLGQIGAQPPYDPTGSEMRAPTGHASVYMNYGGYYTMPTSKRR